MAEQEVLIRTLVELADNLVDEFDVVEMLTTLSTRCVETFGVSDAGILRVTPRQPASRRGLLERDHARTRALRAPSRGRPLLRLLPNGRTDPQPTGRREPRPVAVVRARRPATGLPVRLRVFLFVCGGR